MIFFTAFILSLFLTQIGRAVAQVGHDILSRLRLLTSAPMQMNSEYKAVYSNVYDNSSQSLNDVACSNLIGKYPTFGTIPGFPFIGGAPNTSYGSTNCGACWKITNVGNNLSIYFTSIDLTDPYNFVLSLEAFNKLKGSIASGNLEAKVEPANGHCAN